MLYGELPSQQCKDLMSKGTFSADEKFSSPCADFLASCIKKDPSARAFFEELKKHPFITGDKKNRKGVIPCPNEDKSENSARLAQPGANYGKKSSERSIANSITGKTQSVKSTRPKSEDTNTDAPIVDEASSCLQSSSGLISSVKKEGSREKVNISTVSATSKLVDQSKTSILEEDKGELLHKKTAGKEEMEPGAHSANENKSKYSLKRNRDEFDDSSKELVNTSLLVNGNLRGEKTQFASAIIKNVVEEKKKNIKSKEEKRSKNRIKSVAKKNDKEKKIQKSPGFPQGKLRFQV